MVGDKELFQALMLTREQNGQKSLSSYSLHLKREKEIQNERRQMYTYQNTLLPYEPRKEFTEMEDDLEYKWQRPRRIGAKSGQGTW